MFKDTFAVVLAALLISGALLLSGALVFVAACKKKEPTFEMDKYEAEAKATRVMGRRMFCDGNGFFFLCWDETKTHDATCQDKVCFPVVPSRATTCTVIQTR